MPRDKILFVDDEPRILRSYQRALSEQFSIDIALGGQGAIERIEQGANYAVIVADMRMPGMSGLELLRQIQESHPNTIRMMLTGNIDQKTAVQAVNRAGVFRFLNKPCSEEEIEAALLDGVVLHRKLMAEQELLEQTVHGSIKLLTDLIGLLEPEARQKNEKLRERVRDIALVLELEDTWALELACMLHDIGRLVLPPSVAVKQSSGVLLSSEETRLVELLPGVSASLLSHIPRLEQVAEIVRYQNKNYDGSGMPEDGRGGEQLPLGSRILRIASRLNQLEERGVLGSEAIRVLEEQQQRYDASIVRSLSFHFEQSPAGDRAPRVGVQEKKVDELLVGDRIVEDVLSQTGLLLVAAHTVVSEAVLVKLNNVAPVFGIESPIRVLGCEHAVCES